MLPTLAELEAKLADEEAQALQTRTGIGKWSASLMQGGTNAANAFATAMGRIRDQFRDTREASQRETDAINSSWDRFIVNQDQTVKKMDDIGVDFGDVVEALAARNGVSTVEMAQQYATLGVKYGDTLALIEAAGRSAIDAPYSSLRGSRLARALGLAAPATGLGGSTGIGRLTGTRRYWRMTPWRGLAALTLDSMPVRQARTLLKPRLGHKR